jgi:hypothetical protein
MVLKAQQKKKFLAKTLKKNLLKNSRPHVEALWCKNQENPSDRISHAWAPLI